MITIERIDDIVVNGGIVVTSDGDKIGSVEQVFLSDDSGEPAFVTVRTGLFGMSESFVPLAGATVDGSRILVAYDKERIRSGPRIESDRGAITADEERALYLYFGMETAGVPEAVPNETGTGTASPGTTGTGSDGHDGPGSVSTTEAAPRTPATPAAPAAPHAPPLHEGPRPGPHPGPHAVPPLPHEGAQPGPATRRTFAGTSSRVNPTAPLPRARIRPRRTNRPSPPKRHVCASCA